MSCSVCRNTIVDRSWDIKRLATMGENHLPQ